MSKWRNGHGERDGRGNDPQTWRDEPWLAALLRLVEKDAWVGTEERLGKLLSKLDSDIVGAQYKKHFLIRSGCHPPRQAFFRRSRR